MSAQSLRWNAEGLDWPHRRCSQFVEAGGTRWHVQRMGQGPVVLLVHGTGASSHSWREVAGLLAAQCTVIVPDLPGHGFTAALPAAQMSLPGIAAALSALLGALQLQPQCVVGHSAGAAILVRLCLDKALAPQCLISINGALLPLSGMSTVWFAPVARLMATSSVFAGLLASRARSPGVVQRLIDSTGSRLDAQGVDWYARLISNPAHVAGVLQMMAHWDLDALRRDLPRLATPLLLVVGTADRTIDPQQADRTAALIQNAQVRRLQGLGHLAHEEAPAVLADLILQHTQQHRAGAAA